MITGRRLFFRIKLKFNELSQKFVNKFKIRIRRGHFFSFSFIPRKKLKYKYNFEKYLVFFLYLWP